ncbi:MAG: DUF6892 domain-containing protein [Kofleriaceae bacterium]
MLHRTGGEHGALIGLSLADAPWTLGGMAKSSTPKEPKPPPQLPFEDTNLALCVLDGLVELDLISTSIVIPELAPDDEDDLEDESESWRDNFENNQTRAIDKLLALLGRHLKKLPALKVLQGSLINTAELYEMDLYSLAGIEHCPNLESVDIWTTDKKLDLSPLTKLPHLATVDLTCSDAYDLSPLFEIPSLRTVISIPDKLHPRAIEALKERNIEVRTGGP